jgi:hypothetical protein
VIVLPPGFLDQALLSSSNMSDLIFNEDFGGYSDEGQGLRLLIDATPGSDLYTSLSPGKTIVPLRQTRPSLCLLELW